MGWFQSQAIALLSALLLLFGGQSVRAVEPRLPDPLPFGSEERIAEGVLRAATANDGVIEIFLYYAIRGEAEVSNHLAPVIPTRENSGPYKGDYSFVPQGEKYGVLSPTPYFPNGSVALNFALGGYIQLEEPTLERFNEELRAKMRHLISVYIEKGDAFHRSASDLKELDKGIDPDRFFFGLNAGNNLEKTFTRLLLLDAKEYGDTSAVFAVPESPPENDEEIELPQFEVNLWRWLPVYLPAVKWVEWDSPENSRSYYDWLTQDGTPALREENKQGDHMVFFRGDTVVNDHNAKIIFYWDEERTQYTVIDNETGEIVPEESTVIPEPYKSRLPPYLRIREADSGSSFELRVLNGKGKTIRIEKASNPAGPWTSLPAYDSLAPQTDSASITIEHDTEARAFFRVNRP